MTPRDALMLRAVGLSVIPVHAPGMPLPPGASEQDAGKKPLCPWREFQTRLPQLEEIRAWCRRWPTANVGVVTGAVSGAVVVDVDVAGLDSLRHWEPLLPKTWRAQTGGGGAHLYFAHPGEPVPSRTALLPGVDVKGDGGFVVAPPSRHRSGQPYRWTVAPWEADLAALPAWLLALIGMSSSDGQPVRVSDTIREGDRNAQLYRLARSLRLRALTAEELLTVLRTVNARCEPPLGDSELTAIVEKALRQGDRPDFTPGRKGSPLPNGTRRARHARLLWLSNVLPRAVEWLWGGSDPARQAHAHHWRPGSGEKLPVARPRRSREHRSRVAGWDARAARRRGSPDASGTTSGGARCGPWSAPACPAPWP